MSSCRPYRDRTGPAGRCVMLARDGRLALFVSPDSLNELRDVCSRPKLATKLRITASDADDFVAAITAAATLIAEVPQRWTFARDPDDSLYVNLAIVAGAALVVSRDLDLLDLNIMPMRTGKRSAPLLRTFAS